jgi:hypothetical protein
MLAILVPAAIAHAGTNADTIYTERAKTDFDTFLQILNPYGTWAKIGDKWAFTPTDHQAPYTSGRWLYTEYGWYWKGTRPHSWATEHYGYWKRGADKVWSWYPGPFWLPETIEIRATPEYIGWRSAEVDEEGSFVEEPIDRYSKPEEWSFVTWTQFANPITPAVLAKPAIASEQLEDSTDSRHTYLTYREIDRPGPHPAAFAGLHQDGGMLAPKTLQDEAHERASLPATNAAPNPASPAGHMTGTNQPALIGAEIDPAADPRQVKYWVTMSLPTYWTKPPPDSKIDQLYIYRPDTYQDQDGIERRITLWFNPNARTALKDVLDSTASASKTPDTTDGGTPAAPATPVATEASPGSNPFSSPLDQPFHPGKVTSDAPAPATTNTAPKGPAPSGLKQ